MSSFDQSAAIPIIEEKGAIRVLVITTSSGRGWVVPKGIVEDGMTPAQSAAAEALEEAGVRGRVLPDPLGEYTYGKWGGTCRVKVYLMVVEEILESWPEQSVRVREWLSPAGAAGRVREPALGRMILGVEGAARRLGAL